MKNDLKQFIKISILIITFTISSYASSWKKASTMPLGIQEIYSDSLNGLIYIAGGIPKDQTKYTNKFVSYDAKKDKWNTLEPLLEKRHHVTISASNERIYALGGFEGHLPYWTPQKTMFIYDIKQKSWSNGPNMLTPRGEHISEEVNGKIYVIGGRVGKTSTSRHFEELIDTKLNEVYDTKTNIWSKVANALTARNSAASAVVDGKIYVIGGRQNQKGFDDKYRLINLSTVEVYDPITNTWEIKSSMPMARGGISASVLNGKIYVFGGEIWFPKPSVSKDVWVYDPKFDQWAKEIDMNIPRHGLSSETIGNEIFVFGGSTKAGLNAVDMNEVFKEK